MLTPNLAHLRATACPYYPQEGIQQIVIYGRTENAAEEATSRELCELCEKPICCVKVEFTKSAEGFQDLHSRLRAEIGVIKESEWPPAPAKSGRPFIFSRYNLEWLAEAGRSNFSRRIRGVKWLGEGDKHLKRLPPSCHRTVPRRSTFAMACCIYDKPGTMYRILSSLRTPNGQELPSNDCDLNIDYMRTENLRIGEYYSFEIYGTYTTSHRGSQEKPKEKEEDKENVCGVVFYADFSQNDGLTDWVDNAIGPPSRLRLDKVKEGESELKFDLRKYWRKVYDISDSDNLPSPRDFLGYRNNQIKRDLPSVRQCPISRIVECPIPGKKSSDQVSGLGVRINVLVHNVPGVLLNSLNLLNKLS